MLSFSAAALREDFFASNFNWPSNIPVSLWSAFWMQFYRHGKLPYHSAFSLSLLSFISITFFAFNDCYRQHLRTPMCFGNTILAWCTKFDWSSDSNMPFKLLIASLTHAGFLFFVWSSLLLSHFFKRHQWCSLKMSKTASPHTHALWRHSFALYHQVWSIIRS